MIVLGFDTPTAATVVGLLDDGAPEGGGVDGAGGRERVAAQLRHDPAPGERPGHGPLLLGMAHALFADAGLTSTVGRIAIGLGPGGFTGLPIGVATSRALAQSAGAEIVGLSTLEALASAPQPEPGEGVAVCRRAWSAPAGMARDLVVADDLRKPDAVRSTP